MVVPNKHVKHNLSTPSRFSSESDVNMHKFLTESYDGHNVKNDVFRRYEILQLYKI